MISYRQADYEDFIDAGKMTVLLASQYIDDDGSTPWYNLTWMLRKDGNVLGNTDHEDYNRIGSLINNSGSIRWRTDSIGRWVDNYLRIHIIPNLKSFNPELKMVDGKTVEEDGHTYQVFAEITLNNSL